MMTGKRKQRGFTLIEVLIVVVIIGVLAALIVPRFVAAPEKAIVAEANQMVGSLIRAQQAQADTGGAFIGSGALSVANWNSLGMTAPTGSKFTFSCTSPTCTATRTSNTANTVAWSTAGGNWTCAGDYTRLSNGGCTVG